MSDVRGYGRRLGTLGTSTTVLAQPGVYPADNAAPILADWNLQPGPPRPVEIPYAWLAGFQPLRSRPDKPLTTAAVSVNGGSTALANDPDSITAYGDNAFTATLYTATSADAQALAQWVVDYYATDPDAVPRNRFPALLVRLTGRTQPEMHRILSVGIGTRISITGAPPSWPEGATEQVVEGIRHELGEARDVEWTTAPVVGASPGVAGPWFYLDSSHWDDPDHVIPF